MVMSFPQRGLPRYYPPEDIGQPDETSEVEITKVGELPPGQELKKLPKTILLRLAIELNPDKVSESYSEGWTKDDILKIIEQHIGRSLGRAGEVASDYIVDVDIIDSEVEEA